MTTRTKPSLLSAIFSPVTTYIYWKLNNYKPGKSTALCKVWEYVFHVISTKGFDRTRYDSQRVNGYLFRPETLVRIGEYRVGISNLSILAGGYSLNFPHVGCINTPTDGYPQLICNHAFVSGTLTLNEQRALISFAIYRTENQISPRPANNVRAIKTLSYPVRKALHSALYKQLTVLENTYSKTEANRIDIERWTLREAFGSIEPIPALND